MAKRKRKQKTVPFRTIQEKVWSMNDFERMCILHDFEIVYELYDNLSNKILDNLNTQMRKAIMNTV